MTDKTDLIREIHEYVAAHGGENTATHLLVQAASAIQTQAAELEAVGAGGVQALSAASQPPISNTLWRMLTGGYEHAHILQLPNDSRDRRELIDRACHNWHRICAEIGNSAVASAVSPQTAQAPQQEAQEPATVPYQKLTNEIDLILSDQDTDLSIGAKRALLWMRTWVSVPLYTAPQQEAQEPTADVQAKIASNTWDHFGDILPTLKAISRGDWYWGANTRCKYIEIRIDTRDGGCILYDSKRVRISPQQFAHQSHDLGKMDPWPAKNVLGDTAPQPAPAPLSDEVLKEVIKDSNRYRWLRRPLLNAGQGSIQVVMDDRLNGKIDRVIFLDELDKAIDAALAAQGGK